MTPAPGVIPPSALVTVKGTPVIALMKFLEEQLTVEQRDQLLHSLIPDDRELFDRKLFLAVETYSLAAVNRLTTVAARVKGMAGDEFAPASGWGQISTRLRNRPKRSAGSAVFSTRCLAARSEQEPRKEDLTLDAQDVIAKFGGRANCGPKT